MLRNTGAYRTVEKVQVYAEYDEPDKPKRELCGLKAVPLDAGERKTVTVKVNKKATDL